MALDQDAIDFLVNHVVLPPKQAQENESGQEEQKLEANLLHFVLEAIESFSQQCDDQAKTAWKSAISALQNWQKVLNGSTLSHEALIEVISQLKEDEPLMLHLKSQNSGLLIHHNRGNNITFDAFEASPEPEQAMQTKGRLQWIFTSRSVIMPCQTLQDQPLLVKELATTIESLHAERVSTMIPTNRKEGEASVKERDTDHPELVTEQFLSILAALGDDFDSPKIQKHVRHEVNWCDNQPLWRRSPFWLVIRVSLSLVLQYTMEPATALVHYKNFTTFLVAKISGVAQDRVDPDLKAIISVKAARRLIKLGDDAFNFVIAAVQNSVEESRDSLEDLWLQIQRKQKIPIKKLSQVATEDDRSLRLSASRRYLLEATKNIGSQTGPGAFQPQSTASLVFSNNGLPNLHGFTSYQDQILVLEEFETWVFKSLSAWKEERAISEQDCALLAAIQRTYRELARPLYDCNSRATSVMLLTIFEIWRVLDVMCLQFYPSLSDYNPELLPELLEPLLLPQVYHMRILLQIEEHLENRQNSARQDFPRILQDPKSNCFSVRYYDQSPHHQELRAEIEREAHLRREQKSQEWKDESKKFDDLQKTILTLEHVHQRWGWRVRKNCSKCCIEQQARSMKIMNDEWPLPEDEIQLKATVFELDCPSGFAAWRDTTFSILQDMGRKPSNQRDCIGTKLFSYENLRQKARNKDHRVAFGSEAKSFLRESSFPVAIESILLKNPLHYRLADTAGGDWVTNKRQEPSFYNACVSKLPPGPYAYSRLQEFVDRSRSTNEAIAQQEKSSSGITHHEFLAFASLRAGERIQWLNVLRELASADMTFSAEAVHILIRQTALQAGTGNGRVLRVTHQVMADDDFCGQLLEVLSHHVAAVQVNWKEQHRLSTLVILVLRVLSLTTSPTIADQATELLRRLRGIGLSWCRQIILQLSSCSTEDSAGKLRTAILRSALACQMTFDSDPENTSKVLQNDQDVSDIVEASVYIHNNRPVRMEDRPKEIQHDLLLSQKLSRRLVHHLRKLLTKTSAGINQALGIICNMTCFAREWTFPFAPQNFWAANETLNLSGGQGQNLHYSLLTGELLIDGQPLGRLPSVITEKALYRRVFGARILNVSASNLPQMQYRSLETIDGHEVHLGLRGEELLIKATTGMHLLHVIPHEVFKDDLPHHFHNDFVHWFDIENNTIEFRPVHDPWTRPPKTISLRFDPDGRSLMQIGGQNLIDYRSSLGNDLCEILSVVERATHLVITAPISTEGKVEIDLPRFGVKFFINEDGDLESQQLSSTVAREQDVGCLYGLRNKLVLKNIGSHSSLDQKSVMIPFGSVSVNRIDGHSQVRIDTGRADKIRFMQYHQNAILGTLQGASDATEILFKAYLHAVTSFVLEDPLTGQSGTAEALLTLADQRLKTSFPLSREAVGLLKTISELTPARACNSAHVQMISWYPGLDQLAQHEDFFTLALEIFSHNARFQLGPLSNEDDPNIGIRSDSRGEQSLLERALLRNSSLRIPSPVRVPKNKDRPYVARDRDVRSARALRVYDTAALILEWPSNIEVVRDLSTRATSWNTVNGYGKSLEKSMQLNITNLLQLPIAQNWGYLYSICHDCDRNKDRYRLMFLFATMAFATNCDEPYLRTLLGIAFSGLFKNVMPEHSFYTLGSGKKPVSSKIEAKVDNCFRGFEERENEEESDREKRYSLYSEQRQQQLSSTVQFVQNQWPCNAPPFPSQSEVPLLNLTSASHNCSTLFTEWNKNRLFFLHLNDVEGILREIHTYKPTPSSRPREIPQASISLITNHSQALYPSLMCLLKTRTPPKLEEPPQTFIAVRSKSHMEVSPDHSELRQMLGKLKPGGNSTLLAYVDDLLSSLEAFEDVTTVDLPQEIPETLETLVECREKSLDFVRQCLDRFDHELRPRTHHAEAASMAGLWPRMTTSAFLACLSSKYVESLRKDWKEALAVLGEAVALLQRSERLVNLKLKNNVLSFYKEAEEAGRQGWTAMNHPEWLLIEIEGNMQIRHVQAIVAEKMIAPDGGANSVLQLNMGEGKSSVITPMVVAALADQRQLVRLVCLKPLLKQTNSLLSNRLGGLVGRPVYHIPFARDIRLDQPQVSRLRNIYAECMENQGVILSLPEHILSFRLLGREQLPQNQGLAKSVMSLDLWLQQNCRDVLDESDELLDSKFQLVYSMGIQQHMDAQPERWLCIQAVLSLLFDKVKREGHQVPALEVDYRGRSFPFLTFLEPEACTTLLHSLLDDIVNARLGGVSFEHCTTFVRKAAEKFIHQRQLKSYDFQLVERNFKGTSMWTKLHLLRGLFAHRILEFALQKKLWQVNYGLALDRCLMAVPYRAKGIPSARAEFGHPDVAITLTCFSYYYGGLTSDQLRHAFDILISETDPSSEYVRWATGSLPPELYSLDGVNLDDQDLWNTKVFPSLRYSKAAADFYMARVVFPREGKEFPNKLSLSAWDLVSTNSRMITTGFSGTNDNKSLLPTLIKQDDLPQLQHTNAMVLELLLKKENRSYVEAKSFQGRRLDLDGLIQAVSQQSNTVQVLIDVGAQVLEAENEEVACKWLELSPDFDAAVFFNESDEVMVVDRNSHVEHLSASPFKKKLGKCVIYLDEVHTRGIDLELPTDARAAVTLGPNLTKDRLVQGCMRLRKLGCNQSLAFFAPPEVHQSILTITGKISAAQLDSSDVLRWALTQTCSALDSMNPLYLVQGLEYCHRERVCSKILRDDLEATLTEEAISIFNEDILEPEARTLEEMYGANAENNTVRPCLVDETAQNDPVARPLLAQWESSNYARINAHVLQEEQEREISHEVEQEREVQKAPAAKALPHMLHEDVVHFVKTGKMRRGANSPFYPAFQGLEKTTAFKLLNVKSSCLQLHITKDFKDTVKQSKQPDQNHFVRPVKWVVSSTASDDLVVISPFEANELLPEFRDSEAVRLHVYSARTSKKMRSFSDLSFFTVTGISTMASTTSAPYALPLAIAQLDIFAGCLFFKDYSSYLWVCDFLGLVALKDRSENAEQAVSIAADGFAGVDARDLMKWPVDCPFVDSPLPFLIELMGIRRKGQSYLQTHMGSVVNGRILKEESFEVS